MRYSTFEDLAPSSKRLNFASSASGPHATTAAASGIAQSRHQSLSVVAASTFACSAAPRISRMPGSSIVVVSLPCCDAASVSATIAATRAGSMPALSAVSAMALRSPSFQASTDAASSPTASRVARSTKPFGERIAIAMDPARRSAATAGRSPAARTIIAATSGT